MQKTLVASLLLVTGFGCRTAQNDSKTKDLDWADTPTLKDIECEKGDPITISLKPFKGDLTVADFPKINDAPSELNTFADDVSFEIDACQVDEDIEIKRGRLGDKTVVRVSTPVGPVDKTGLKDLLFDQKYSGLKTIVPVDASTGVNMVLLGSPTKNAMLVSYVTLKDGEFEYKADFLYPLFYAGEADVHEYVPAGGCDKIKNKEGKFTLGTATFTWKGLQEMASSGGSAPKICELTVTDTAKALGDNAGKTIKYEIPLGEKTANYDFETNHHSVCDSFMVKTPGAIYAFTASSQGFGGGSCSRLVKGAPSPSDKGTKFVFTYGQKKIEGLDESCFHPTRKCGAIDKGDGGFGIEKK